MTSGREEAEDLVAQTLMLAAKGWAGFDGRHPTAWLLKILVHACGKMHQKSPPEIPSPEEFIDGRASNHDVVHQAEVRWTQERVLAAMEKLCVEQRLVITLCDIEEMSYDEVARALNLPKGTLCSRLFRARRRLQALCIDLGEPLT
jgi:RNA polymerase sigma-70 factor (ECF subfamily)